MGAKYRRTTGSRRAVSVNDTQSRRNDELELGSETEAGESLRRFLCRFAQDCFKDRRLNRFAEVAIETCLPAFR